MSRYRFVAAMLVLVSIIHPGWAQAKRGDEMQPAVARLAKELQTLLADQRDARVWVEPLVPGSARLDATLGIALSEMLADELRARKVGLDRDAPVRIKGKFRCKLNDDERLTTRIDLEIWRHQKIGDLSADVVGLNGATRASSRSQLVPTEFSGAEREQLVQASVLDDLPADSPPAPAVPAVAIDGTLLRLGGEKGYAVEVRARPASGGTYRPLTPTLKDGQACVEIGRDEVYAVRVVNDSPYDAAVKVFVDGLNVFHFFDRKNEVEHFFIPSKKAGAVLGWPRTNQTLQVFHVKGLTSGAAYEVDPKAAQTQSGLIQVRVARAWNKGTPIPPEERGVRQQRGQSLATARGQSIAQKAIQVERVVGDYHAFFAIRYTK